MSLAVAVFESDMSDKVLPGLLIDFSQAGLSEFGVPGVPDFGRSVNPITPSAVGQDFDHLITTGTLGF